MKTSILMLAALLALTPVSARAQTAENAYGGAMYAGTLDQDRGRLASDEEDVARDKDLLNQDRNGYRWWLLSEDTSRLKEDQSRLSQDYDVYASDSNGSPGAFTTPE